MSLTFLPSEDYAVTAKILTLEDIKTSLVTALAIAKHWLRPDLYSLYDKRIDRIWATRHRERLGIYQLAEYAEVLNEIYKERLPVESQQFTGVIRRMPSPSDKDLPCMLGFRETIARLKHILPSNRIIPGVIGPKDYHRRPEVYISHACELMRKDPAYYGIHLHKQGIIVPEFYSLKPIEYLPIKGV